MKRLLQLFKLNPNSISKVPASKQCRKILLTDLKFRKNTYQLNIKVKLNYLRCHIARERYEIVLKRVNCGK